MKETLRPLGDKIVVRREEPDRASPGGILLPDNAKEKPTRGVVVAVGPGKFSEEFDFKKGETMHEVFPVRFPVSVKVNDVVLFSAYAGSSVEIDGQEMLIMREDDILCVVEKSK